MALPKQSKGLNKRSTAPVFSWDVKPKKPVPFSFSSKVKKK